jgi:hypothetical protein
MRVAAIDLHGVSDLRADRFDRDCLSSSDGLLGKADVCFAIV